MLSRLCFVEVSSNSRLVAGSGTDRLREPETPDSRSTEAIEATVVSTMKRHSETREDSVKQWR